MTRVFFEFRPTGQPRMAYHQTIGARRHRFDDLRTLLARASPLRSGDLLAGVAAVEAVAELLAGLRLAGPPSWSCVETRIDPLMSEDHAANLRVYTGVVQARLRSHA